MCRRDCELLTMDQEGRIQLQTMLKQYSVQLIEVFKNNLEKFATRLFRYNVISTAVWDAVLRKEKNENILFSIVFKTITIEKNSQQQKIYLISLVSTLQDEGEDIVATKILGDLQKLGISIQAIPATTDNKVCFSDPTPTATYFMESRNGRSLQPNIQVNQGEPDPGYETSSFMESQSGRSLCSTTQVVHQLSPIPEHTVFPNITTTQHINSSPAKFSNISATKLKTSYVSPQTQSSCEHQISQELVQDSFQKPPITEESTDKAIGQQAAVAILQPHDDGLQMESEEQFRKVSLDHIMTLGKQYQYMYQQNQELIAKLNINEEKRERELVKREERMEEREQMQSEREERLLEKQRQLDRQEEGLKRKETNCEQKLQKDEEAFLERKRQRETEFKKREGKLIGELKGKINLYNLLIGCAILIVLLALCM